MSVKYIHLTWTQARDVAENRLLVLLALADWANEEGYCWPTMQTLATKARIAVSTARALIRSLERDGYLTTEIGRGFGHHNTYTIHIPPLASTRRKPPTTGDLSLQTTISPAVFDPTKSPTDAPQERQPDAEQIRRVRWTEVVGTAAHRYYLMALGQKVKEQALDTRKEKETAQGPKDAGWREFHATRLLAYFEVVALMQEQARAYGIPLEDLGLEDIDPFEDLL